MPARVPDTAHTWRHLLPVLAGAVDGCIRVELARGAEGLLAPSSRMLVIEDAGHFLHLEKPGEVNEHILAWVTG